MSKFLRVVRHNVVRLTSWLWINYYRLMGIKIGQGGFISLHAYIDVRRGKVIIGNNVSISRGVMILSHIGWQPSQEGEITVIEDNVILFVNAVIFPGVRIGKNSIVGAASVVMKDVPPNVIVMGNPARVIQHLEPQGGNPAG
jgi:acetyltransferase-like isoleucine patch superfamily enzyme